MKKFAALLLSLVLVLSMAAALAQDEVPTLTISTWSANIDTITANVFAPFEEANNCKIVLDLGNNAPRLAKVTENPENYDIVYFSDLYVQKCIEADVFLPIDQSRDPAAAELRGD